MTALEHGRDMRFAHIRFESIHKCQFECIEAADWLQAERYSTTCIHRGAESLGYPVCLLQQPSVTTTASTPQP